MADRTYRLIMVFMVLVVLGLLGVGGYQLWQHLSVNDVASSGMRDDVTPQTQPVETVLFSSSTINQPLDVVVNDKKYVIESVSVRDDWVTLSTKRELGSLPDLELKFGLHNHEIDDFSNKKLQFSGKAFTDPHIQISWKEQEKSFPKSEYISKKYDLRMQFGQEKDFRIPVQFFFSTDENVKVRAAGSFMAKTSDLVVVNGKIDIHQDNHDTVLYVAEQFIKDVYGLNEVKNLQSRGHSLSYPTNDKMYANPGYVYSNSDLSLVFDYAGKTVEADLILVRTNDGWIVYRALKPERIKTVVTPDRSLDTLNVFGLLGDEAVYKKFDKVKVKEWESKGAMLRHGTYEKKEKQVQTGHASYLVKFKDGSQRYVKITAEKQGVWKIKKVLDGSQIPQAHVDEPVAGNGRGSDVQQYLAAKRLEKALNIKYPDLQVRAVDFSCGYSNLLTQCIISWWRMVHNEEKCEGTKYMYRRENVKSAWQYVRELGVDEELDHRDGIVKKKEKPRKYHCW